MDIAATGSTTQPTASQEARTKLTGDLQSFLTLLTTQLKHQDPLEPLDSTEFTSQLAQFAGVEQNIQTNANLEKLIGLSGSNQGLTAVGYLGKYVEAKGNTAALANGQATFAYELPSNAAAVAITVRNESGVQVTTVPGELGVGRHTFTWDGLDLQGVQQADGKYTISVTAVGNNGESLNVQTFTAGIADGADSSSGTVKLTINGVEVPLSEVIAVREPPAET